MLDIIVNPLSGNGKSLEALRTVETILIGKQIEYVVHRTNYAGHAIELAKQLNQKDEAYVIAMGGDGTYNEILNGITDFSKIVLGFIPCGTGNDYIKATKIPNDVKKSLELILKGDIGYTDYIQLDNKRALNCVGTGMDVDVLVKSASMKFFKGKAKYYASLIYTLLHLNFHKIRITLGDKVMDRSIFMVAVANGKYIGGGMPASPLSDVKDGKFNLVFANQIKPIKIPKLLIHFLKGKHIYDDCTESYLAEEVSIELLDGGKAQVDGEVFDDKILHCKLMHNVLRTYE